MHINDRVSRIKDGVCYLIPLTDYIAWSKLTGNIVYFWEYDILMSMDESFCSETNLEFEAERAKAEDARQSKLNK